jgi:uncharacterized RDD family membrane protein YckC
MEKTNPQYRKRTMLARRRLCAKLIDTLIVALPCFLCIKYNFSGLYNALGDKLYIAFFIAPIITFMVYDSILLTTWGTTPGKKILGLKVNDSQGAPLIWKKSFLRSVWMVSLIILYQLCGYAIGFGFQSLPFYDWFFGLSHGRNLELISALCIIVLMIFIIDRKLRLSGSLEGPLNLKKLFFWHTGMYIATPILFTISFGALLGLSPEAYHKVPTYLCYLGIPAFMGNEVQRFLQTGFTSWDAPEATLVDRAYDF